MTPATFWAAALLMAFCIYVPPGQWDEASLDELLEAVADPERFERELEVERFYDDMERWERGEG